MSWKRVFFSLIEVEAINELEEEFEKKLGVPMELLHNCFRISTLSFGAFRELKQKPKSISSSWFNHLGTRMKNIFLPLDTLGRFLMAQDGQ